MHISRNIFSFLLVIVLILGSTFPVAAQEVTKTGTSAATFLRIPVGARGAALGGAIVASATDASSMYWNPGGLSRLENFALIEDYSPWLPGLSFNYIGLVVPLGTIGNVGINITSLSTKEMDITTPASPMGTGETFDAAFTAVGFSYAKNLTNSFSIGATVKYINERIYNSNATGIAFDIGTIYDTPFKGVRLGFSISNIGTKMQIRGEDLNVRVDVDPSNNGNNETIVGQLKTDRFDMPMIMRVGLAWDAMQTESTRLTLGIDGLNPNDNAQSVNVGAEVAFLNEVLLLRAGYNELFLDSSQKGLALGAGFNLTNLGLKGLRAEYAFQQFKYLGNVSRYTLTVAF